jgi:hypothetical protein
MYVKNHFAASQLKSHFSYSRENTPSLSDALHLDESGLFDADVSEKPSTVGLVATTVFLASNGQPQGIPNFSSRFQSTSKVYRQRHPHDFDELHNVPSYDEKFSILQKSKTQLEKDFLSQKALAERLQKELAKIQKQFGASMKEIEEVVNSKWQSIVAEKDAQLAELHKELKMEKYAAFLRKRETEGKSEGLVPGSRKFDMEVEKVKSFS